MNLFSMRKCLTLFLIPFCLTAFSQDIQEYISKNAKEIDAAAKGFKGFNFLDTVLKNKRIVLLGESSHGTEEYSKTKLQLIEYLHHRLGFNVILFESPMTPGTYLNLSMDTIAADSLIRYAIQSIWHTNTVLQLFNFIKENKLYFGGFDPQFISSPYSNRLFSYAFSNYPGIKKELMQLENRIDQVFKQGIYTKLKDSISFAYSRLATKMEQQHLSPLQKWIEHMVTINIHYYANLYKGNQRDSCMADNLVWLAEKIYPSEKIIVWAHNSHIDKNASSSSKFMGKILSEYFGTQLYAVGLYMVNGSTALNNRDIIQVKEPAKNSLESLLSNRGFKTAFIETNDQSFDKKVKTFHWGKDVQKLNLARSYDAVILINGVSPPAYLKSK